MNHYFEQVVLDNRFFRTDLTLITDIYSGDALSRRHRGEDQICFKL